ncbi:RecX family transcriptional regulator [Tamlana agarivorans]|uniref:RecX family transcriptional regulator n=1 Tax=Pseudotamlana agarivorans TaxID=481183 RepID=A0ACC5U6F4_9FLAO|nr:regulatory protein RecX [Tamlana agarivorans]MBU2949838.1 RecX family transcriptional regulator [Tamlana agarivorans]
MLSKKTYTVQEATKKMEHYCAYQERCHQEVRKKLVSMFMIPEAIDVIIVHLLDENYLNEERFAKAFVRGKFRIKHWGKRRLTSELKQRDISKFNITQALAEIDDDEYIKVLTDLSEKRANLIKEGNTYKKRKKFIDYFLYRGWESHLVYEKAHEFIT